jgi:hypothetical protein
MHLPVDREEEDEADEEESTSFSYPLLSSRSLPATPMSAPASERVARLDGGAADVLAAAGAGLVAGGPVRRQRVQGSARSYVLDVER